jgi:uncharacterized membrane protein HdeD (DUF308 family)
MQRIDTREDLHHAAKLWWLVLALGILWVIYAFIVLSFEFKTVLAIAVFAGVGMIFAGVTEFFYASQVESWRWAWIVLGVISVVVGVIALAWPDQTFLVLAAIVGWYLMLRGVFDVCVAFLSKDEHDLWWLGLVLGLAEIVIGFWAVGYVGRSIALLVVWVGAYALVKGITDIVLAFRLRHAGKALGSSPPSATTLPPPSAPAEPAPLGT